MALAIAATASKKTAPPANVAKSTGEMPKSSPLVNFWAAHAPHTPIATPIATIPTPCFFDSLLPTRMGRTVQLTEITKGALSRAIRRSNGLHQRPVSMFLAIFMDAELSQEHAGNLSRLHHASRRVGFHYNHFPSTLC
jgi:hypothetical protein